MYPKKETKSLSSSAFPCAKFVRRKCPCARFFLYMTRQARIKSQGGSLPLFNYQSDQNLARPANNRGCDCKDRPRPLACSRSLGRGFQVLVPCSSPHQTQPHFNPARHNQPTPPLLSSKGGKKNTSNNISNSHFRAQEIKKRQYFSPSYSGI